MIKFGRLIKSFRFAFSGFLKVFHEEQNFKIQTAVAVMVFILGFYFNINLLEWAMLIFVIGMVMIMEMANSAVERVIDLLKPRIHSYAKEVKDIMAATVMLASIISIIVGIIIFYPYLCF